MGPRRLQPAGSAPMRAILAAFTVISLFLLVGFTFTTLSSPLTPASHLMRQVAPPAGKPSSRAAPAGDKYLLGVGKADITGPVVEINFAGYASLGQVGSGLRQRIYSRAFIVGDVTNPKDRFVYLVLDTQSGDAALRNGILDGLKALGSDYAAYGSGNVAVTGTHSHSGPGAWFNYLLPQITSKGFDKQGYQAIVDGALLSIQRAHKSLTEVSRVRGRRWNTLTSGRAISTWARRPSRTAPSTAACGPTSPTQSRKGRSTAMPRRTRHSPF